jgi:hypothetical protein
MQDPGEPASTPDYGDSQEPKRNWRLHRSGVVNAERLLLIKAGRRLPGQDSRRVYPRPWMHQNPPRSRAVRGGFAGRS